MRRVFWGCFLILGLLLWGGEAQAGVLADRLAQFPHWDSKPPVSAAKGDLVYPDWMEGTWNVTSTLVDLVAPLAPEIVTPGFESNRRQLNQPVNFPVRFKNQDAIAVSTKGKNQPVVADRAFNGLSIGKAYLGDRAILSVKVDPNSPNRQVTLLRGDRQLVSIVTSRGTETLAPDRFIATEVSQQVFRGTPQPYFNIVETTTAYQWIHSSIEADQVTAIYLSPQDPDYFKAVDQPVALYRYQLQLLPVE
ncbi:DUF6816 family protein [Coleofasciculus sp. FACHB-SPT9]|uniref:DUF6816 family protein n=1 Tax=Cyanophyceae TaxID=3028117 RepID=UPI001684BD01|nr:hypothetical protein [Coleofasciculus sp. FACHB-SPT9]MBD1887774.1 hypothetical protein [Coleofasciculus sp. FACHB-SPT9]